MYLGSSASSSKEQYTLREIHAAHDACSVTPPHLVFLRFSSAIAPLHSPVPTLDTRMRSSIRTARSGVRRLCWLMSSLWHGIGRMEAEGREGEEEEGTERCQKQTGPTDRHLRRPRIASLSILAGTSGQPSMVHLSLYRLGTGTKISRAANEAS